MGGGQMYVRNKLLYERSMGWNACVIAGQGINITIPELKEFKNTIYELNFYSYEFSKQKRKNIESALTKLICDMDYDEIVIETTSITTSTWAESISEKIGAKHFIFLLQERNVLDNHVLLDFFKFKYNRKELAGITLDTLPSMFSPHFIIDRKDSYFLSAHCNNVMADVDFPMLKQINRSQYDYTIGCLSRLDKPFVFPALKDFLQYVLAYPDKKYLLLLIGDAPSDILNTIKCSVSQYHNVDCVITGYLYPVPTQLLEFCDAFFCSAGSCWVCAYSGVPTISYDGKDFRPIGILEHTTMNSLFRNQDEPQQDFKELMDLILIEKVYEKKPPAYERAKPDFHKHDEFVSNSEHSFLYYDTSAFRKETKTEKCVSLVLLIIGADLYGKLRGFRFSKWLKHKFVD